MRMIVIRLKLVMVAKLFLMVGIAMTQTALAQPESEIARGNTIFDWAERSFPDYFSPAGVSTLQIEDYLTRFYAESNTWLAIDNDQVYVYGPLFDFLPPAGLPLKAVGSTESFLALALEEQNVPGNGEGQINNLLRQADEDSMVRSESPVRRIDRRRPQNPDRDRRGGPDGGGQNQPQQDYRSIDGYGNNEVSPAMGAAGSQLKRTVPTDYADGISALAGNGRPSPRMISNILSTQTESIPNAAAATDMLWQWGQFLDHDLDLTDGVSPEEPANIAVPAGDVFFDPNSAGTAIIRFNRSIYDSNVDTNSPRQQLNEITSWIDGSNVYGSDIERADALRTLDGSGRLKVSAGNLLPFNSDGLPNAGGDSAELFLAGDVRANEQVGLTVLHTLFVREHNRLANEISQANPSMGGDEIYQRARQLVGAQLQVITYREYLPTLLGTNALSSYRGYDSTVDASISNLFATASYRYGHSALSPKILRLNQSGREIPAGNLALRDAFFSPQRLRDEGGVAPILRGLSMQVCESIDPFVVDDVRNFLFGPPGAGGFDLVSLNIQRGRDHGLASYNDVREALGLIRKRSFSDISNNPEIVSRLQNVYETVDDIDVWVGGLAERKHNDAMVGELLFTVFKQQFEELRDGDRFWYEQVLSREEINRVRNTSLADIIRRNTTIGNELDDNVFQL